jgi:glucosamine--fructose-6-phosphate aminotransferase (isomerizing)
MMFDEASQAADVVAAQLTRNAAAVRRIGALLRRIKPAFVATCARGSSDHSATYAKYLIESRTGILTASLAPSIHSVYKKPLHFDGGLCLVISQSGASPDLLAVAHAAKQCGAHVLAILNMADSPLAAVADDVIEIHAGREQSVAATKSFIGSLSALLQLVAAWQQDDELTAALTATPDLLRKAWDADWCAALEPIAAARNVFVLGRGVGLGIAQEAALKLKEVCGLHAEAYSAAEVLHGPIAIAKIGFPVLVFAQRDETRAGLAALVDELLRRDIALITAGVQHAKAINLPEISGHPAVEPLLRIQSFYRLAVGLSLKLGLDPDRPPYLTKVTATV